MAPSPEKPDDRQGAASGRGRDDAFKLHSVIERYKAYDQRITAGHDVFVPGQTVEGLHCLRDGWAFHYDYPQHGLREIEQFVLPGDILSTRASGGTTPTQGTQALTDVVVSVVPMEALDRLAKDSPDVHGRLTALASRRGRHRFHDVVHGAVQSAPERISGLILELFGRYRARWPGQRTSDMHLPLTLQHIADATGFSHTHADRAMSVLTQMGVVTAHEHGVSVMDPDTLMDVAKIHSEVFFSWLRE